MEHVDKVTASGTDIASLPPKESQALETEGGLYGAQQTIIQAQCGKASIATSRPS